MKKSEEISEAETRALGGLCRRRSRAEHRPYPWSPARSSFGGGPTAQDWGYLHVWPDRRTRRHRWAARPMESSKFFFLKTSKLVRFRISSPAGIIYPLNKVIINCVHAKESGYHSKITYEYVVILGGGLYNIR